MTARTGSNTAGAVLLRFAVLVCASALVLIGGYCAERFTTDASTPSVPTYTIQLDDLAMDEGASTPIGVDLPELCGMLLGILLFVLMLLRPTSWVRRYQTPLPPWSIETGQAALTAITPMHLGISRT
ncbi:hypothetical protein [Kribbella deserti]|uniref:Uncharacterized protein n=1 Tax=Kribbella deserti TaxID=1926257 RepID=A0ABV6QH06_9ACTN